jgi:hypothetical protein
MCLSAQPCHPHHSSGQVDRQRIYRTASRRTLEERHGPALLAHGYTALPNTVLMQYRRLGITDAEFLVIVHLWSDWWGDREQPCPAIGTLAGRLGKSVRQVQHLITSLQAKGLLGVYRRSDERGGQISNAYDLRPFVHAVETLLEPTAPAVPDPNPARQGIAGGPAQGTAPHKQEIEKTDQEQLDLGSIPLSPPKQRSNANVRVSAADNPVPSMPGNQEEDALACALTAAAHVLGDSAPRSSLTRARRLAQAADLPERDVLDLIARAVADSRRALPGIELQLAEGGPNGMPYFFAVLQRLIVTRHAALASSALHSLPRSATRDACQRRRPGHTPHAEQAAPVPAVREPVDCPLPSSEHPAHHALWPEVLATLQDCLAPAIFTARVRPLLTTTGAGGELIVLASTPFLRLWLERQLHRRIQDAVAQITGDAKAPAVIIAEAMPTRVA